MAPSRRLENVTQLVAPRGCAAKVAPHSTVLAKRHAHNVVGLDVLRKTVSRGLLGYFIRKGTEQSITDDKRRTVITVEIAYV